MSSSTLKHRYSFSGSDTKVFAYYSGNELLPLEGMHTLSCSVYEAKGRVRSLGFKSIRGFARSVREISGTMIMLVINDHPLKPLMVKNPYYQSSYYGNGDKRSWSFDAHKTARGSSSVYRYGPTADYFEESDYVRIPTTLPPFNLLVHFQSEIPVGSSIERIKREVVERKADRDSMGNTYLFSEYKDTMRESLNYKKGAFELVDVEIMGEGIVTSVNDMVTEIQYQFVARDYKEYSLDKTRAYFRDIEKRTFESESNRLQNDLFERFKNDKDVIMEIGQDGTILLTNVNMSRETPAYLRKQLFPYIAPPNFSSINDGLLQEESIVDKINQDYRKMIEGRTNAVAASSSPLHVLIGQRAETGDSKVYSVGVGHPFYEKVIPQTNGTSQISYYTVYPATEKNGEYTFKVTMSSKDGKVYNDRIIKNNTGQISYEDFLE